MGFPGGSVVKAPPASAGDMVQTLFQKDSTCHRGIKSLCATTIQLVLKSPRATATEAQAPSRARGSTKEAPANEKLLARAQRLLATLEKSLSSKRPSTAKNNK